MVLQQERFYTAEEFWDIAQLPENQDKRLELDDGVIVEIRVSSPLNTVTSARLAHFLNAFVIPQDLGYVTGADGGFKLAQKRVRRPDVGFISKIRVPKLPKQFDMSPDLAVEVVSPTEDVFKKVKEYIRSGTRMVWVVYAQEQVVDVFTPTQTSEFRVQELTVADTLDGGDILPGFTLPVRDIFPA